MAIRVQTGPHLQYVVIIAVLCPMTSCVRMCALYARLPAPTAAYLRRVPQGSALQASTEQLLLEHDHVAIFTVVVIVHNLEQTVKKVLMSGVYMRGKPVNDKPLFPTWSSSPSSNTPRCTSDAKNLYPERGECRQKGGSKQRRWDGWKYAAML